MTHIFIGSDHGAIELRKNIIDFLLSRTDIKVTDCGTHTNESVDYPDIADSVINNVLQSENTLGVLCCGTGIGISIRANRYKQIRAALVYDEFTAQMAKEHNNANVLCLGGRTTSKEDAIKYVSKWLDSQFEGGRHQRRLDKLDN